MSASERLSKQLHATVDATPADWRAWIQLVKLQPQLYAQKRNVNENETTVRRDEFITGYDDTCRNQHSVPSPTAN
jgi:hypothetical protein